MSLTRPTSELRNRRTGEVFKTSSKSLIKQSIFGQTLPTMEKTLQIHGDFINDFFSRFSEFPSSVFEIVTEQLIAPLKTILTENFNHIERLKKNPSLVENIKQAVTISQSDNNADPGTLQPFIANLVKSLTFAGLNLLAPGLGILAAMALPVVSAELQVQSGIPQGGSNLCNHFGGYMISCLSGYLTDKDGSWRPDLPQFIRLVQQGNNTPIDDGAFLQLKDCLDINTVGNAVKAAFEANPGNKTFSCTAEPTSWFDWQSSAIANNMPENACATFKDEFAIAAHNCAKYSGAAKWNGFIAGSVVGGILLLACCCGAAYAVLKSDKCENSMC